MPLRTFRFLTALPARRSGRAAPRPDPDPRLRGASPAPAPEEPLGEIVRLPDLWHVERRAGSDAARPGRTA